MIRIEPCSYFLTLPEMKRIDFLMRQLSGTFRTLNEKNLYQVIKRSCLYLARDCSQKEDGDSDNFKIVGMASIHFIPKIAGLVGQIEEVVVDNSYRGQGIGKTLVGRLIEHAKERKAEKVYLTSRPSRVEANKLYRKLGFELHQTNAYSLPIDSA